MGTLSAAISHLLGGDSAVRPQRRQRSGVFPGPATGARSGCSSGPESVFGLRRNRCSACAGMGVRLAPESVFDMARCTHMFGGYDLRQSDGKLVRCEKKASGETECRVVQEGEGDEACMASESASRTRHRGASLIDSSAVAGETPSIDFIRVNRCGPG